MGVSSPGIIEAAGAATQPEGFSENLKDLVIHGGIKSFNEFGRARELENPSGRRLYSKNEYFATVQTKSGWGLFAQGVESQNSNGSRGRSTTAPEDPSIGILHPIYENDKVKMWGLMKEYLQVGDYSVHQHLWEQSYYWYTVAKLKNKINFFNVLIPRYFSQPQYAPDDTTFFIEDYLTVSKPLNKWLRYGIGQHTQMEEHPVTLTGVTSDIYPFLNIQVAPKSFPMVFIEPRIHFPIYVNGSVYDAPRLVSLNEAQAEIYIQVVF